MAYSLLFVKDHTRVETALLTLQPRAQEAVEHMKSLLLACVSSLVRVPLMTFPLLLLDG